jgi:hypothetical protein
MIDLTNGVCFRHGKLSANMARAFAIAAALAVPMTGRTAIAAATLEHALYGTTQDRQAVDIFTMTNEHGLRVRFLSLGGVITEIDVPDRTGRLDNIALGLRTLQEYETLPGHFGAITGRYANRIGGAQFTLNGVLTTLLRELEDVCRSSQRDRFGPPVSAIARAEQVKPPVNKCQGSGGIDAVARGDRASFPVRPQTGQTGILGLKEACLADAA